MRVEPVMTIADAVYVDCTFVTIDIATTGATLRVDKLSGGAIYRVNSAIYTADAEIY